MSEGHEEKSEKKLLKMSKQSSRNKGEDEDREQGAKLNPKVAVTVRTRNENGEGRSVSWQVWDVVSSDIMKQPYLPSALTAGRTKETRWCCFVGKQAGNSHWTMIELENWGCSMEDAVEKHFKTEALRVY